MTHNGGEEVFEVDIQNITFAHMLLGVLRHRLIPYEAVTPRGGHIKILQQGVKGLQHKQQTTVGSNDGTRSAMFLSHAVACGSAVVFTTQIGRASCRERV